ncbi:hypothetical protein ACFVXC_01925 [Streptomyces sp. NPDC058257]|uniref:hypothetical protein n=1 Tax=Streptomyces sp. NPDC058257 TaxID=3346409 RepID=UPI0036F15CB5
MPSKASSGSRSTIRRSAYADVPPPRRHTATALRWIEYGERQHAGTATDALACQAQSPDPEIRAHGVADAPRRGAPDAYERLPTGPEPPARTVSCCPV